MNNANAYFRRAKFLQGTVFGARRKRRPSLLRDIPLRLERGRLKTCGSLQSAPDDLRPSLGTPTLPSATFWAVDSMPDG